MATAWFLAGLGAVPFVIMALGQAFMPGFANAYLGGDQAFLGYGAVILSFMGGVRWGAAACAVCSPNAIGDHDPERCAVFGGLAGVADRQAMVAAAAAGRIWPSGGLGRGECPQAARCLHGSESCALSSAPWLLHQF
jgi:hypothetical protein